MNYTIKTMAQTIFVGTNTRQIKYDTKAAEQFWQKFSQNNTFARIDNLLSPKIVALYSKVNITNMDCFFWLGGLVSEQPIKNDEQLPYLKIPEQAYAVFKAKGAADVIVPEAWLRIDSEDLDRSYINDMEIYTPIGDDTFEVEFYVSLN